MKISPRQGLEKVNSKLAQDTYRDKAAGDFQKLVQQAQAERDDRELKKACQEMEAVFIHKMLQQMRATIPEGGLLPDSMATKIYRDMLDEAYSKIIAESRDNMGLGELLYRQLKQDSESSVDEPLETKEE